MSHNLYLIAERTILVESKKKKKYEKQRIVYNGLIQTPTEVTNNILATNDPFFAYLEWLKEVKHFKKTYTNVYHDENDYWGREPRFIAVSDGLEMHKKDIDSWIKNAIDNNYTVIWSST